VGISTGAALIGVVYYRDLCYLVAGTLAVSAAYIFTRGAQRKANLPAYGEAPAAPSTGVTDASESLSPSGA
jgi:hypothetical protein